MVPKIDVKIVDALGTRLAGLNHPIRLQPAQDGFDLKICGVPTAGLHTPYMVPPGIAGIPGGGLWVPWSNIPRGRFLYGLRPFRSRSCPSPTGITGMPREVTDALKDRGISGGSR